MSKSYFLDYLKKSLVVQRRPICTSCSVGHEVWEAYYKRFNVTELELPTLTQSQQSRYRAPLLPPPLLQPLPLPVVSYIIQNFSKAIDQLATWFTCFYLACFRSRRWRRHVPPKRWLIFNGLCGVISQTTELFWESFVFAMTGQWQVGRKMQETGHNIDRIPKHISSCVVIT
jgi:hypothetical protein